MKLYLLMDAEQWSYKQTSLQPSAPGKSSLPSSARLFYLRGLEGVQENPSLLKSFPLGVQTLLPEVDEEKPKVSSVLQSKIR